MKSIRRTSPLALTALALLASACSAADGTTAPSESRSHAQKIAAKPLPPSATADMPPALRSQLRNDGEVLASVYLRFDSPSAVELLPRGEKLGSDAARQVVGEQVRLLTSQHAQAKAVTRVMGGVVVGEFTKLLNALHVRVPAGALERLRKLPHVVGIDRANYYTPTTLSAVPWVGASKLWDQNGNMLSGQGMTIGIVDTGIDYLHADFGGSGNPADYQNNDRTVIEAGTFPTAKVLGGYDFVGDDFTGQNMPNPDPDPLDCATVQGQNISGGHGTHVAGIAAGAGVKSDGTPYTGPYTATLDPSQFRLGPGAAPDAKLYALKVFGCNGGGDMIMEAFEWSVDPNNDNDLSDHLDVVNASLGSDYSVPSKAEWAIIRQVTKIGTMIVAAAGNAGHSFFATGTPASYNEILSVANSLDQLTALGLRVNAPSAIAQDLPCVEGSFTRPLAQAGAITSDIVATAPTNACADLTNAGDLAGKVALISRGGCYFADKVARAEAAGAVAVIVTDNVDSEVAFAMGGNGNNAQIPGVMVRKVHGDILRGQLNAGVNVTLDAAIQFDLGVAPDQAAGSTSRGPRGSDLLLKPDIAAPGTSIDSAGVASGTGSRQLTGTSMASPLVAGAAALVRQAHPMWTPQQVKSALMNSVGKLSDTSGNPTPASIVGAGRMKVDVAAGRSVIAYAVEPDGVTSISFGALVRNSEVTETREIELSNSGSADVSFTAKTLFTYELAGVTATVRPATINVPAGQKAKVTLSLTVDPTKLPEPKPDPLTPLKQFNDYSRHYMVEAGGRVRFESTDAANDGIEVPFFSVVRRADTREAMPTKSCGVTAGGEANALTIGLGGGAISSNPVTSVFELGATSEEMTNINPELKHRDILAVGAATNIASITEAKDLSAYFGIVVAGDWATPARGGFASSLLGGDVAIGIDTNGDNSDDFWILPEVLGGNQRAASDILVSAAYRRSNQQNLGLRYLNIFPREDLDTRPYNNRVIVLAVTLEDLGLTPANAKFRYRAFTYSGVGADFDATEYVEYDAAQPAIDTSVLGHEKRPFFIGSDPIRIKPSAGQDLTGKRALILHHSNVLDKSYQIVDLDSATPQTPADLAVKVEAPAQLQAGATASIPFTVTNNAGAGATGVKLTLDSLPTGATLAPSQGTCSAAAPFVCELGDLAAGASATVTVSAAMPSQTLTISASISEGTSCESSAADNDAVANILLEPAGNSAGGAGGGPDTSGVVAEGGCSCSVPGQQNGSLGLGLLGACVALGAAAARRRRS